MRSSPYAGEALRVLGERTFANPAGEAVRVLGVWSPAGALAFMEEIGAALPASGPPDPAQLAEIYRRHNSELVP
jgi:hypothetical protein